MFYHEEKSHGRRLESRLYIMPCQSRHRLKQKHATAPLLEVQRTNGSFQTEGPACLCGEELAYQRVKMRFSMRFERHKRGSHFSAEWMPVPQRSRLLWSDVWSCVISRSEGSGAEYKRIRAMMWVKACLARIRRYLLNQACLQMLVSQFCVLFFFIVILQRVMLAGRAGTRNQE